MKLGQLILFFFIFFLYTSCGSGSKFGSDVSITVRNKSSLSALSLSQSKVTVSQSEIALNNSLKVTVTLLTNSGTPFISDAVTVALSASGGTSEGTLSSITNKGDGTYEATFTGTTVGSAITISAKVNDNSITSTFPTVTVVQGGSSVATSTVSVSSSTVVSGSSVTVTLRAKDSAGNNLTTGGLNVAFSRSGGTSTGTFSTVSDNSDGTYTATFTGVVAGSATTITATIEGASVVSTLPTVAVSAGAPASIAISGGGNNQSAAVGTLLGTVLNVVVKDANNNLLSGITVDWSVTAGGGSLSLCTATTNASGISNCSYTLGTTPGANTITATVNGTAITISFSETATVGAVAKLLFVQQPSNTASGSTISPSITVRATDSYNNTVTAYATNIDIAIDTNPSSGTLSGTVSKAPASGVSTFDNLSLNYNGTGYKLIASSGALTTATSNAFNITATAVSYDWPFDAGSEASYTIASGIDLTGGVARLTPSDQTDDENTTAYGFLTGTPYGLSYGTLSDGTTSGLKFAKANGCNATATNCTELDSTWTPEWNSLISYWKMENNWNDSVGTNNGTGYNSAAFSSSTFKIGSYGGTFPGSTVYVDVGNAATLAPASAMTFAIWIYPTSLPANDWKIVAAKWYDNTPKLSWHFGIYNKKINIYISPDGTSVGPELTTDTTDLTLNTWTHLAFTVDTATDEVKIYRNGVKVGATGSYTAANLPSVNAAMVLGNKATTPIVSYGFSGYMDESALWSKALTPTQIKTIYDRQSAKFSGSFTSRIMNGLNTTSAWTTLSWITTLPFGKELPDAACSGATCTHTKSENSTSYSSLVGSTGATSDNNLMSGIVGLWHFNEASWSDVANEVIDDSGNGYHARGKNGATTALEGMFYRSGSLDGTNDYINLPSMNIDFTTQGLTLSVWAKPTATVNWGRFFDLSNGQQSDNIIFSRSATTDSCNFTVVFGGGLPENYTSNAGCIENSNWHHFVITLSTLTSTTATYHFYKNSIDFGSGVATLPQNINRTANYMGKSAWAADPYYKGYIDEVAIWNRPLTASEIKQLYLRGASRIKYQVRSCDDNACSGETWKGPDGTNGSYFSELNNNSTPFSGSGNVNPTPPSLVLASFTAAPSANQYFQYRAIFEADYSLPTPSFMPELKSVTVDPVHYNSSSPAIYGGSGLSYYSLVSLAETPGAGGCPSGITYNVSTDKINWKYWDGSAWSLSGGTAANSNSASVISTNASTFPHAGVAYIKALLNSTGTSKCELDGLHLSGQN